MLLRIMTLTIYVKFEVIGRGGSLNRNLTEMKKVYLKALFR